MEKKCYSILFTTLLSDEEGRFIQPVVEQFAGGNTPETINYSYVLLVIMMLVGLTLLWKWRTSTELKSDDINDDTVAIGKYQFDYRNMILTLGDEKIELSSKEADLLKVLLEKSNTTLERDELLKKVWGDDGDYIGRTLDVFISKLRKKLELDDQLRIANVRGVGYKLILNN